MLLDPDVGRRNRWTTIERVPAWILRGEIVDVRLLQASRDVELNGCDPETEEHRACGQQRHDRDGTRDEEPLTKEEQQHEHCGRGGHGNQHQTTERDLLLLIESVQFVTNIFRQDPRTLSVCRTSRRSRPSRLRIGGDDRRPAVPTVP